MDGVRRFLRDEEGQDTVEYALVLGLIAIACVAAMSAMGTALGTLWGGLSGSVAYYVQVMLSYIP